MVNKKRKTQTKTNKKIFSITSLIIFSIFIMTILSQGVLAEKTIKEDWFNYEESFIVGSDVYTVQLAYPNFDIIRFKQNNYTTIIKIGQCENYESYSFCYQNYSFDKEANIDHNGNLVPGIQIKIIETDGASGYKATIKSSESGNKYIGYEQDAIIKIENTGETSLFGAEITIIIPENITITNTGSFTQIGNKIITPVSISKDDEKEYKFTYKAISKGTKKFEYNLLRNGSSIKKSSFSINAIPPYEIKITKLEKIHIREIQTFEVQIKNTHTQDEIKINEINIQSPVNFQYLTTQKLTRTGFGQYSSSNIILQPGNDVTFTLRYRPFFAGKYKFDIKTNIEQKQTYEENETKELEVINDGLAIALLFTKKEISLQANTELQLILKNEHKSLAFKNIKAVINSELYNETKELDIITSGNTITLLNEEITPPQIDANKEYEANATITFTNEAGQLETVTLSDKFKITGNGTLISITQKINPTKTVKAGDEIIVEVNIKNLMDNSFRNVQIEDTHTQKLELIVGEQSKTLNLLSAKQQEQTYIYKVKVPEKPTSEELEITTTIKLPEINYETTKTTKLKIEGEIYESELIEDEQEKEQQEKEQQNKTETLEEEQEKSNKENGFLRRMIKGIENFFSNIF